MIPFLKSNFLKAANTLIFTFFVYLKVLAGNEPIASGSFVINMGITPQTVNNGLRPYGMVYDLVRNFNVPVKWIINQSKIKDGIDFSHNGIDYRGGTFVIPAENRTGVVNARITYWQGQGVVGATTVAPITVDVYITLKGMPTWTLNAANSSIGQKFLTNAAIPSTAVNSVLVQDLTCCNDLFVMPHADPVWSTHSRLLSWNLDCKGAIWLGCHAGSALEGMFNPAIKSQQTNFLSQKTGNAVGSGPYEENALILWGNHDDGTTPYSYSFPSDPIAQFMGIIDGATQNGSEQIYLPKVAWNSGTKVYVSDPTQTNVPSLSPGPAAVMISGKGFDDPLRGRVMMIGGHDIAGGTAPANIAAQRAFMNFSFLSFQDKAVYPTLGAIPSSLNSLSTTSVSFNLPLGANISDYTITWNSSCGGSFAPSNSQTTTFTAPNFSVATPCVLSVSIRDACGRVTSDAKSVTIGGCNVIVTPTISNTTCAGGATNGSISMAITNGPAPYSWTWTRVSPVATGNGTGTLISNLTAGTYNVVVTTGNGCTKSFQSVINNSPAVTAMVSGTNPTCFGQSSGSIVLTVSGGTPAFTYLWSGGVTTQNRNAIPAGNYSVTVTDSKGCTATASTILTAPSDMVISPTLTPVACFGNSTGAIVLTVSGGTGSKSYAWSNGAATQNLSNLTSGTYSVTVTDVNGCAKISSHTITQPAWGLTPSITATNYACASVKGSINLSVGGGAAPYTFAWSNGATTEDLSDLNVGNYTVTITDSNGCTAILSKAIIQIPLLNLSTSIVNSTCPTPGTGSINLTVTGGTLNYNYVWADGPTTQNRNALLPGVYTLEVIDAIGCKASTSTNIISIQGLPNPPGSINH